MLLAIAAYFRLFALRGSGIHVKSHPIPGDQPVLKFPAPVYMTAFPRETESARELTSKGMRTFGESSCIDPPVPTLRCTRIEVYWSSSKDVQFAAYIITRAVNRVVLRVRFDVNLVFFLDPK